MRGAAGHATTRRSIQQGRFQGRPFHLQALEFTQVTNNSVRHRLMFRSVGSLHRQFGLRQVTINFVDTVLTQGRFELIDSLGKRMRLVTDVSHGLLNFRLDRFLITAKVSQTFASVVDLNMKSLGL